MTEDEFFDDYEKSFSRPNLERIYFGTREWEGIDIPIGVYIYKNKVWEIEQYPDGTWGKSKPAPYWTIKFFRELKDNRKNGKCICGV